MWSVAKSYMRMGFLTYEEMHKYLTIYEEFVSHIWLCNRSFLNFLIYEENLIFFFISAELFLMQKNYKELSPVVYSAFNVKITQPLWYTWIWIAHILHRCTLTVYFIFLYSFVFLFLKVWLITRTACTIVQRISQLSLSLCNFAPGPRGLGPDRL